MIIGILIQECKLICVVISNLYVLNVIVYYVASGIEIHMYLEITIRCH